MSAVKTILVCVPTYNESESILKLLSRVSTERVALAQEFNVDLNLLVMDDNSPDHTADIVEKQDLKWVAVMRRPMKGGLGPAYIAGFHYALSKSYDLIAEMDADLSHQPEQIKDLLKPVLFNEADLTIGTRWMPGGKVVNWPLSRQLISRAGTGYARLALRIDLRDITSGFRIFRRSVLERINLDQVEAKGYGFQIEMALKTLEIGCNVVEVPITFVEREGGVSKMSKRIVIEALTKVTLWALQRLLNRR